MLHFRIHVLGRGDRVGDMLPEQVTVAFLESMNHHAHRTLSALKRFGQFAVGDNLAGFYTP